MAPAPSEHLLARHRRETFLECDASGRVIRSDACASSVLEVVAGDLLVARACEGLEDRVRALCADAIAAPVEARELCFTAHGRIVTVGVATEPSRDGFVMFARVIDEDVLHARRSAAGALREIDELHRRVVRQSRELERPNDELSASNRAILQLHDELAHKAEDAAARADVRSRIVARVATMLVDDMLDLSTSRFGVRELLETMRGMLQPLVPTDRAVVLDVDLPSEDAELETDRGKLAQVLRNLIANGLKYTPQGSVRVSARIVEDDVEFLGDDRRRERARTRLALRRPHPERDEEVRAMGNLAVRQAAAAPTQGEILITSRRTRSGGVPAARQRSTTRTARRVSPASAASRYSRRSSSRTGDVAPAVCTARRWSPSSRPHRGTAAPGAIARVLDAYSVPHASRSAASYVSATLARSASSSMCSSAPWPV